MRTAEQFKYYLDSVKIVVDKGYVTACWEWPFYKDEHGYGVTTYKGIRRRVSVISWMVNNGDVPTGLNVLHHCDNPACFRCGHLFVGTQSDNIWDAVRKGRWASKKGTLNGRSVLTEADVIEIRKARPRGQAARDLAMRLGVDVVQIRRVINRETWKHI